jgi:methionine--tRNA ligase beta chain
LGLVGDEAETKKWIQFKDDELVPALKSGDQKQIIPKLVKLSKALESLVFLVNNKLSVADLANFVAIAPTIRAFSDEERSRFDNISRWFDHIQHLRFLSAKVSELKLDAPISQKFVEPKKEDLKKEEKKPEKKEPPKKEVAKGTPADTSVSSSSAALSPSRLDFRVGKIVGVQRHPGADTLYQEEIDVGEEKPRQVVSGLVKFVPIEEMKDRLVVVLCNLKAANMRGVRSEGMVIAASNDDHSQVQLVDIPAGSKVGERITVAGDNGPADKVINLSSKDNVFKTLQEHLRTNETGLAVFKDAPLVTSQGPCTVKSLFNAHLG